MKKILFIMFALMTTTWASAQTERLRERLRVGASAGMGEPTGSGMDQLALKRLVDTFAEVHSKAGEHVSMMKGKEQIGKAFANLVSH